MDNNTTLFETKHPLPSYDELYEKFSYDPETGDLSNKRTGYIYQHRSENGYIRVTCGGRSLAAHRVAWMLTHGRWPIEVIDHINGVRDDNRLVNIREATVMQNLQSRPMHKRNKLGVKGVTYEERGKYRAQLWTDGRFVLSARYDTLAEATAAYQAVSRVVFGQWNRPD